MKTGYLFPAGGWLSPEQMIGRSGDVHDLVERLREGQHCTLVGPRRIGKTTVCNAACERLRVENDFVVVHIETPEQASASAFCQELIDRYTRISATDEGQHVKRAARPLLERLLESLGIPLDLSEFGAEVPAPTRRAILELPLRLREQTGRDVVLFADELQRAVDYADGVGLIGDVVDIYTRAPGIVVLADGSEERAMNKLLGAPYGLAKLTQPRALAPRMPRDHWRQPLQERFHVAELETGAARLDAILDFGDGLPYPTMCAAGAVALKARQIGAGEVDDVALERGLEEARERIDADR